MSYFNLTTDSGKATVWQPLNADEQPAGVGLCIEPADPFADAALLLSSEQARQIAAGLVRAADQIDEMNGVQP